MKSSLETVVRLGEWNEALPGTYPENDRFERVVQALGRPTARGESYAIYRADSLELLTQVPRASIDLAVTSPPYNIGKAYEKVRQIDEYLDWCERWIELLHQAAAPKGAFWLNLGYLSIPGKARAVPIPYLLWDRVSFFLVQEVIWNYGAGVASKLAFSPRNEKFLWYVKSPDDYVFNLDDVRDPNVKYPNQKKNGKLKCNPLGKNPSDVWNFPKVTSGSKRSSKERTPHPAQFPTSVIDRIIRATSNKGDIVLDPFVGSGSAVEAALAAGRYAIGFEIDAGYADLAASRISNFLADRNETARQSSLL